MFFGPVRSTNITKLVTTSTGHMIAALILFYDKFTKFALAIMQIVLKKN